MNTKPTYRTLSHTITTAPAHESKPTYRTLENPVMSFTRVPAVLATFTERLREAELEGNAVAVRLYGDVVAKLSKRLEATR